MKNPLVKRLPRELKSEFAKYLVIFLFIAGTIAFVSGWNVAGTSMTAAYDESFEKYAIEDGSFELNARAETVILSALEADGTKLYEKFYYDMGTKEVDSTLRVYRKRTVGDLECLMEGEFPSDVNEIAIDRMYAENNSLSVGDTLTVGGKAYTVCGFVALSDYSALFSNPSDMMFDAVKFGVAVVTEECFDGLDGAVLHYSYGWRYDERPADNIEARELSESLLTKLYTNAVMNGNTVTGFIPEYTNQAIIFAGEDIGKDSTFITLFLYIVVIIISFIFAITTANTIAKEATVIGTLRATGYTKGELVRHYITMPILVMLAAAIVGNVLGYTVFRDIAASVYYASYSLTTFKTLWNSEAFIKTTVVPLTIMLVINLVMLVKKLSLSPLKFIRRDLSKRRNKKALRLNTKIGIMKRFRIRVILQNMPNYITIFVGVFLANAILLFGMFFSPMLGKYQEDITTNLLSDYQYILKLPAETSTVGAEKYTVNALKTIEGSLAVEEITVYGLAENSAYIDIALGDGVYISNAYAEKHHIEVGDKITLTEEFGTNNYSFKVDGVYNYPAALCVFMSMESFCTTFTAEPDYSNGYFSNTEITDIDSRLIATEITADDLTKTSRQLKLSLGSMMSILLIFGIVMFMLIVYLLSKIIIEKNAQSISVTKILGYQNNEINGIYIMSTSIIVVLSMLVSIPLVNLVMEKVCDYFFATFPGWLPYYVAPQVFVEMAVMGVAAYAVIAFFQTRHVRKIPMADALKNVE